MKKVLAAALLCAVSSFAAWDKFPVVGLGKGEARVGMTQSRQGTDGGFSGAYVDMRYSLLQNLELSAGTAMDKNYTIGARYQVIPMLGAGVDIGTPIGEAFWTIYPSVQFSMELTPMLSLGSNVGVAIYTEDYNKETKGMDLDAGVEFDVVMGKSIIFVGVDIGMGLTVSKYDGKALDGAKVKDEGRGLRTTPSVGYIANVGDNLGLLTFAAFSFGDDAGYKDAFDTTVGVEFTVKF